MNSYFFTATNPVHRAVTAFARLHPSILKVNTNPLYVSGVNRAPGRKVALVSGGGSGHEPLHAGFVGQGMLDAAVPGQIFASPHNRQVYEASKEVALEGGVLHIIKNYTGDKINFGIAAERLRADGIPVARVIVDDDISTESATAATGRRGTGATVIVEKILGAAADAGLDLDELVELGEDVAASSRSIAVASRAQTSPTTGKLAFELADGELEYGVGIHGERAKSSIQAPATAELVERMLGELLENIPTSEHGIAIFVNGLGSVTTLELLNIQASVSDLLEARGIAAPVSLVGSLVVALDMRGFSLTATALKPDWESYLLAPSATAGFPALERTAPPVISTQSLGQLEADESATVPQLLTRMLSLAERAHGIFTEFDQASGDGDFGDNLVNGLKLACAHPGSSALANCAHAFLTDVGGSSGPLLGLLFQHLEQRAAGARLTNDTLLAGLASGLEAIQRIGGAQPGDRTLVDALAPAAASADASSAVKAAFEGALATSEITARMGRSSYVGDRAIGTPDPGACGVALLIGALTEEVDPALTSANDIRFADWLK